MFKKIFIFFSFLVLAGLNFSTSHYGDGTYKLLINDSIISDNDFTVKVTGISYTSGQDLLTVDNVTYRISSSDTDPVSVTLHEQESHTVTADNGTRNVTITAVGLGYDTVGTIALIVVPYADTEVESSTFIPPKPDVGITSINITPSFFSAVVNWSTNKSANGTARLYDDYLAVKATAYKSTPSYSFTSSFSNLSSNSNYSVLIIACTDEWCVNSTKNFSTLPVVPEITNVKVLAHGDVWANIYWETDVKSDERVFYRKSGDSIWKQVPAPSDPWKKIKEYVAYEPGKIVIPGPGPIEDLWQEVEQGIKQQYGTAPEKKTVHLAAAGSYTSTYIGIQTLALNNLGITTDAGKYKIASDIIAKAPNIDVVAWLARQTHQINLKDLSDQTAYEFKVSSCADRCANSSIYSFTTNRTNLPPTIEVATSKSPIYFGTSEVLYLRFYANNPGADISSVQLSWNDGGTTKTMIPKFSGDPLTFAPAPSGGAAQKEVLVSITFANKGMHTIKVSAIDSIGMNASKDIWINAMKPNSSCIGTSAMYFPADTTCTDTWPNGPKGGIEYNTGIDKCHAFEVCDASLDYVLADAESCCNGERSFSDNPEQNWGYGYNKNSVCDDAINNARTSGAMTTLGPEASMKICKASYIVYGLGSGAVYMKDYYTGEFCCADSGSICSGLPHFTAGPWPQSNILFGELHCYFTKFNYLFGTSYYPKKGWYSSDSDPKANNNAAVDIPPHSSINIMNTGTCVDYSFAITTLMRKAGFGQNEIITMNAPGHAYNLVWLPGASKYTFIDTVGNNGGDFFSGPGWGWTAKGAHQDHCTYKPDKCSNDFGIFTCPTKSQIEGC